MRVNNHRRQMEPKRSNCGPGRLPLPAALFNRNARRQSRHRGHAVDEECPRCRTPGVRTHISFNTLCLIISVEGGRCDGTAPGRTAAAKVVVPWSVCSHQLPKTSTALARTTCNSPPAYLPTSRGKKVRCVDAAPSNYSISRKLQVWMKDWDTMSAHAPTNDYFRLFALLTSH